MQLYTNGTIRIVEKNKFTNKDTGEEVEYFTAYIKDEEGGVLKLSSGKHDLTPFEGKEGLVILNARDDGGRIKLSVIDFKEQATINF